jgi:NDP-sugar pyrophosphorylase family protein
VVGFGLESLSKFVHLHSKDYANLEIVVINDQLQVGAFDALKLATPKVSADYVLLVLGNLFFKLNLDKLLVKIHRLIDSSVAATVFTHPNSLPNESDLARFDLITLKLKSILSKSRVPTCSDGNNAFAGIFLIKKSAILERERIQGDIVNEFLKDMMENKEMICALPTTNFIADTGTGSRLLKVKKKIETEVVDHLNQSKKIALFFDLDGTLRMDNPIKCAYKEQDVELSFLKKFKKLKVLEFQSISSE